MVDYTKPVADWGRPNIDRELSSKLGAEARQWLLNQGYDSVQYAGEDTPETRETIILNPNQIKSADPVTYDEQGNVIPLSQRFNESSNDIRFSVAPSNAVRGIEPPSTIVPMISSEDANAVGGLKQSVANAADKVIGLTNKLFGTRVDTLLLQNTTDFAPNIPMAGFVFSMSTLQSERNLMRTLLEQKFPDLDVTLEDDGNVRMNGALRKDGQPTPKYFSDLAEDIQKDFDAYDFTSDNVRDFFKEVVEYNNYTNAILLDAGITPDYLVNDDDGTTVDLTKVGSPIFASRGRVTHRDLIDNPSGSKEYRNRAALTGSKGQRKFMSEQEGVDAKYIYPDHPFDRLINQVLAAKAAVYAQRLFSDSNFRSVAVPLNRTKVVKDTVDPISGEPIIVTKSVKKGNELREDVVRLGMLNMRAKTADAVQIQKTLDGAMKSSQWLNTMADVLSLPSRATLTGDVSSLYNQGLFSFLLRPKQWGIAAQLSIQNLFNKKDAFRKEVLAMSDVIKIGIQHGAQWATVADEFIVNSKRRDVLEPQSGNVVVKGARKVTRPIGKLWHKFGEQQGIFQSLAASYTFKADLLKLKAEGKYTAENIAIAAKSADNIHGRENLNRYGINANLVVVSRAILTAPGMYAGFLGAALDMASKNPQVRKTAAKRMALYAVSAHVSYALLAMAAEMLGEDDDDETTFNEKAKKIFKRMIPGSKDYMTIDVVIGGRAKKLAWGGFFRGVTNAVFGAATQDLLDTMGFDSNQDKGFVDNIGSFLSGKMRNGIHMTRQLITNEDYFGNPATKAEILIKNFAPLSISPLIQKLSDPVMTFLHQNTGLDLVTLDRISESDPTLGMSVFDVVSNFVGLNGYVETDAKRFQRDLDKESKALFNTGYDNLDMNQARKVRTELNKRGVMKPKFKGNMEPVFKMNKESFKRDFGSVRYNNLDSTMIDSLTSTIPFNVTMQRGEEATRIPETLRKKIRSEMIEGFQQAYDAGFTGDALKLKAKIISNDVRRKNGLPTVR